jgi:hypothetical protein
MGQRARYVAPGDDSTIVVDLYDSAYGRTLRLDTQRLEGLAEISGIFSRLAEQPASRVHLASREGFLLADTLVDVVLSVETDRRIEVVIEASQTTVKWRQPSGDWRHALGLVAGLMDLGRGGQSGHQYLTEHGAEILVDVAFRE